MIFDREPVTRLIGLAGGIHLKTQRIAERALKEVDLTYAQFGTLMAIAEKDGRSQRELADRLETDSNTVMVVCDSLQRKGLVERRADPADRRVWRISLTQNGSGAFAKGLAIVKALYKPLLRLLSDQAVARALPVLERLYGHLKERERDRAGENAV